MSSDDYWNWSSRETWTVWYSPEEVRAKNVEPDRRTPKSTATIDKLKRQVGVSS